MSTRSWISIKVKPEDIGTLSRFNPDLLHLKLDIHSRWEKDTEYHLPEVELPPFLVTYCHYDGYPSGLGEALLRDYNTYEKALNLILGGTYSTIIGNDYHTEDFSKTQDMRIHNFLAYSNADDSGRLPDLKRVWKDVRPASRKTEARVDPDVVFLRGHFIEWSYKWKNGRWWVKPTSSYHDKELSRKWKPLTKEFIEKNPH